MKEVRMEEIINRRERGYIWLEKELKNPALPAVVLALVVLIVQLLVTYLVNRNFKKQSLIERIRFS